MSEQAVEACVKDQALLDKLTADQKVAFDELKVNATPTFFINGERLKGAMAFEELDEKLAVRLEVDPFTCLLLLAPQQTSTRSGSAGSRPRCTRGRSGPWP
jgi:hypothetical protein